MLVVEVSSRFYLPVGDGIRAKVPGGVHTALMDHGIIGDPFYRKNDENYLWVGRTDWTYYTTFNGKSSYMSLISCQPVLGGKYQKFDEHGKTASYIRFYICYDCNTSSFSEEPVEFKTNKKMNRLVSRRPIQMIYRHKIETQGCHLTYIHRWMIFDFTSFLTVFQLYQDDGWMIAKGRVK